MYTVLRVCAIACLIVVSMAGVALCDQITDQIFSDLENGKVQVGRIYQQEAAASAAQAAKAAGPVFANQSDEAVTATPRPNKAVRMAQMRAATAQRWRLGASWSRPQDSSTREAIGDGWGVGVEYSLLEPGRRKDGRTDLSLAAGYKSFANSDSSQTFDPYLGYMSFREKFEVNAISVGLHFRAGEGASPSGSGFYAGGGIGLSYFTSKVSIDQSADMFADSYRSNDHATKLEWSVCLGDNIGRSTFVEAKYSAAGAWRGDNLGGFNVMIGSRF